MLKTIRLSKNMFSLTERLPKAKYRSPKAFGGSNDGSQSLLPSLTNQNKQGRNGPNNANTLQPDETKPILK